VNNIVHESLGKGRLWGSKQSIRFEMIWNPTGKTLHYGYTSSALGCAIRW